MCKGPEVGMGVSWGNTRRVTVTGAHESEGSKAGWRRTWVVVIQRLSLHPCEGSHWRELGKGMSSSASHGRSLCWLLWRMVGMGGGSGSQEVSWADTWCSLP